ncbi:hypothetical protein G6F35_018005 [Rhizopus arrhizus]|nr:hypothetical protein G6F35_018005 [Rhizopus arrhizus]
MALPSDSGGAERLPSSASVRNHGENRQAPRPGSTVTGATILNCAWRGRRLRPGHCWPVLPTGRGGRHCPGRGSAHGSGRPRHGAAAAPGRARRAGPGGWWPGRGCRPGAGSGRCACAPRPPPAPSP